MRAQARQLTHDPYADDHVGESRATVLHTETLGQLVDRLATVWTRSCLIAENDTGLTESTWARVALHQLGKLCTGYDDLVTDVERGRRRLPAYQTPTGPDMVA